ncbi:hypothetical protein [Sphingomonas asaccharolytica]|uniref:hypothetical protein n=1 Tax=Sphingomonas asaccharolytica TaxID=40681 RepID=UPI000831611C|nr:hypothetical protein [Sphingomonas asaccharolytica]
MAILDASLFQDWIAAAERSERQHRLFEMAGRTGNKALVEEIRKNLEITDRELNAATKAINEHYPN